MNKIPKYTVEFKSFPNGDLEIRYFFNNRKDDSYYSWKLPEKVAEEFISSWKQLRKKKTLHFPVKKRTENCEFILYKEKSVLLKEIDSAGDYKTSGLFLPEVVVEELVNWMGKK